MDNFASPVGAQPALIWFCITLTQSLSPSLEACEFSWSSFACSIALKNPFASGPEAVSAIKRPGALWYCLYTHLYSSIPLSDETFHHIRLFSGRHLNGAANPVAKSAFAHSTLHKMHMYETLPAKKWIYFFFFSVARFLPQLFSSLIHSAEWIERTRNADQNMTKTLLDFWRATCDFSPLSLCKSHPRELHRRRFMQQRALSPSYYITQQCSLWENISNILAMQSRGIFETCLESWFLHQARIEKGYNMRIQQVGYEREKSRLESYT